MVSSLDYDEYIGRIAIGRVERGTINRDQQVVICKKDGAVEQVKVSMLQDFVGLKRHDTESATVGDIIAVSGIPDITIGDTICDKDFPEPILVDIDEPTISMYLWLITVLLPAENFTSPRHIETGFSVRLRQM